MKILLKILLILGIALGLSGCNDSPQEKHMQDLENTWESLDWYERGEACYHWHESTPEEVTAAFRRGASWEQRSYGEPISVETVTAHFEENCK